MIKQTNPFYTITEAAAVLIKLGADPYKDKPTAQRPSCATYAFPWGDTYGIKPEESIYWQEHILGMMVRCVYTNGTHHYVIEIHLDNEGFDCVLGLMEASADEVPPLLKESHSDEYDKHYIAPDTQLELFKLVPKDKEESK